MQLHSHATAINAWIVTVTQSPHVVNTQECEYVVKSHTNFHIWLLVHLVTVGDSWELI